MDICVAYSSALLQALPNLQENTYDICSTLLQVFLCIKLHENKFPFTGLHKLVYCALFYIKYIIYSKCLKFYLLCVTVILYNTTAYLLNNMPFTEVPIQSPSMH